MNPDTQFLYKKQDLSELDELTEEHLGFSPLSNGLGFEFKTTESGEMGTGAVAAGPAKPVMPRVQQKVMGTSTLENNLKTAAIAMQEPGARISIRAAAFFTDIIFITAPVAVALLGNFTEGELRSVAAIHGKSFAFFYLIFLMSYFLLSESFGGQSPGKMLWGLRIVEDDKYQKPIGLMIAFCRLAAFFLSVAFFGVGLLVALWDSKSRPFHDRVTGSIVRSKK